MYHVQYIIYYDTRMKKIFSKAPNNGEHGVKFVYDDNAVCIGAGGKVFCGWLRAHTFPLAGTDAAP